MAARGTRGLTDEQIDQLRAEIAAGKTPRVQVTSAQLGGLTAGTVRAVGDPEGDGADYVTVRVKINGVTDDLRFAPRELSRGRTARTPRTAAAASSAASTTASTAASTAAPAVSADVQVVPPPPVQDPPPRRRSRRTVVPAVAPAPPPTPAATPAATPGAAKPRRSSRRTPSALPVTIAFTSVDATWTVSAQRGARTVVKAATVNPGVVSALAAMLAVPAIDEAVAAVNDTARAEAELRAEQLRAELAELEAVLDSHRQPKS